LRRFGFNVARTAVDGLGQGNSDVVGDFQTIVYQLKYVQPEADDL
jgi:hypothetical protein